MDTDDFKTARVDNEKVSAQQGRKVLPGGLFIVFEGIDGTGKSTQVSLLAEKLRQLGYVVVATREPTEGPYGRRIRELFHDRTAVSQAEELELFIADRSQHVREVIEPALTRGCVVISDRYYLSTMAYQGANGMDPEMILKKNAGFPVPDLAIILEIEPTRGIQRIQNQRNEHPNTFEQETNLRKAAEIFKGMKFDFIRRIDGSGSVENVHHQVLGEVASLIEQKYNS